VDMFTVSAPTTANLAGGSDADVFTISAPLTGGVDGQDGSDTLNVAGNVTLTGSDATGFSGTSANVSGNFAGVDTLAGSGTLTGENLASTWSLGASQTYNDGSNTLAFSGYGTLQGGTAADTFTVSVPTTASLAGGAGADVFTISAPLTGSVDGQAGGDTLNVAGKVVLAGSGATRITRHHPTIS